MKNIKLILATFLGIIVFLMVFTLTVTLIAPAQTSESEKTTNSESEKITNNMPVIYNQYRVALIVIEVETIEDVTKIYKMRYGTDPTPGKIMHGFAEYVPGEPVECIIVIPFAFRAHFKDSHMWAFATAGHELNHCMRGEFHLEDDTLKTITF